jgi:hypothetical protein
MDKARGFRHDRMIKRGSLPPAGGVTEKIEQFQWFFPIL